MNVKDTPDSFAGYLYKGMIYYGRKPDIMNGKAFWPQPMGKCVIPTCDDLEGLFECKMVASEKVEPKSPFERIK